MKTSGCSFSRQIILIFILSLFIVSCSQQETARITIDLDSSTIASAEKSPGLADRILSFLMLSRSVYAAPPANITSYQLTVTAPDLTAITENYPSDTTQIVVDIPAGKQRKITVTANIDPSDIRAVLAYSGSATVNLNAGDTKNITLAMQTSETKLVIPDYSRSRVVQINDMTGTNWKILVYTQLTGITLNSSLKPYDIAIDAQGRIYLTNYNLNTDTDILRIDSIPSSGTTAAQSIISTVNGIQWISIDMKNSVLYFATATVLYRAGLDGSTPTPLKTITVGSIYGINVDDDGLVYIVYSNHGGTNIVEKYNPSDFSTPSATFNFNVRFPSATLYYYPTDVIGKNGKIFVSTTGFDTGHLTGADIPTSVIVQLDSNLQFEFSYGTGTTTNPDTAAGRFYGPYHFVATLNRKLYIIDDGASGGGYNYSADKLVAIDGLDGGSWETYGSSGYGTNEFGFYYGC